MSVTYTTYDNAKYYIEKAFNSHHGEVGDAIDYWQNNVLPYITRDMTMKDTDGTERTVSLVAYPRVRRDTYDRLLCQAWDEANKENPDDYIKCDAEMLKKLEEESSEDLENPCRICYSCNVDITTKCGHSFCNICLKRSCEVKNECPICREDLSDELKMV